MGGVSCTLLQSSSTATTASTTRSQITSQRADSSDCSPLMTNAPPSVASVGVAVSLGVSSQQQQTLQRPSVMLYHLQPTPIRQDETGSGDLARVKVDGDGDGGGEHGVDMSERIVPNRPARFAASKESRTTSTIDYLGSNTQEEATLLLSANSRCGTPPDDQRLSVALPPVAISPAEEGGARDLILEPINHQAYHQAVVAAAVQEGAPVVAPFQGAVSGNPLWAADARLTPRNVEQQQHLRTVDDARARMAWWHQERRTPSPSYSFSSSRGSTRRHHTDEEREGPPLVASHPTTSPSTSGSSSGCRRFSGYVASASACAASSSQRSQRAAVAAYDSSTASSWSCDPTRWHLLRNRHAVLSGVGVHLRVPPAHSSVAPD